MTHYVRNVCLFLCVVVIFSCDRLDYFNKNAKDPIIVKVGDRTLFKSELAGIYAPGVSSADSVVIVDGYIENWIRESLMIEEAEQKIATNLNINKLVDDYRSSLLVYNYENKLVNEQLDTIVAPTAKLEYYAQNKESFELSHAIYKCIIAEMPKKIDAAKRIIKAGNNSDLSELIFEVKENSSNYFVDTSSWLTVDDIKLILPADLDIGEEQFRKEVTILKNGGHEYFVKVLKKYSEKSAPPFDYIEDNITKIILSNRKTDLLKNHKKRLYNTALEAGKIKVFK